jgi:hypothetical protein
MHARMYFHPVCSFRLGRLYIRLRELPGGRSLRPAPRRQSAADAAKATGAVLDAVAGGGFTRESGETAEAFTAQATAGASLAPHLPDNGR